MNNIEDMQKSFEGQKFKVFSPFKCDISKNEDGNYVDDTTIFAFAWFCRGIASQAQQTESQWIIPTESQILAATEKAGLWPNTVYTWLPAFHRYHAELAKLPPAPEGDKP